MWSNIVVVAHRKNTIRQSNQRGIVVHGTNNLLLEENVAFDVKGHSYVLEDVSKSSSVGLASGYFQLRLTPCGFRELRPEIGSSKTSLSTPGTKMC